MDKANWCWAHQKIGSLQCRHHRAFSEGPLPFGWCWAWQLHMYISDVRIIPKGSTKFNDFGDGIFSLTAWVVGWQQFASSLKPWCVAASLRFTADFAWYPIIPAGHSDESITSNQGTNHLAKFALRHVLQAHSDQRNQSHQCWALLGRTSFSVCSGPQPKPLQYIPHLREEASPQRWCPLSKVSEPELLTDPLPEHQHCQTLRECIWSSNGPCRSEIQVSVFTVSKRWKFSKRFAYDINWKFCSLQKSTAWSVSFSDWWVLKEVMMWVIWPQAMAEVQAWHLLLLVHWVRDRDTAVATNSWHQPSMQPWLTILQDLTAAFATRLGLRLRQ